VEPLIFPNIGRSEILGALRLVGQPYLGVKSGSLLFYYNSSAKITIII